MWTVAMRNHGELFWLLIGLSSSVTVYHDPSTPMQNESLTLVCTTTNRPRINAGWFMFDVRYSSNCSLSEDDILRNNDDPTNYNVTCDIQPDEFYQYNLTIHRLENNRHEGTWSCSTSANPVPLNVTVLVRADQPVWTPGPGNYIEGQLYTLTCSTNRADPFPVFSWWMTGSDADSRELEGASSSWPNDTGIYNTIEFMPNRTLQVVDIWCRLIQGLFGERDSERHRVNVIPADPITLATYPHVAVTSESLTFMCTVTTVGSYTDVHLFSPEGTVSANCDLQVDDTTASISCVRAPPFAQYNVTVHQLQKSSHAGLWTCVEFKYFNFAEIDIILLERAGKPKWEPGRGQYVEDQEYNLTCSTNAVDSYPTFHWWFSDSEDGSDREKLDGPKIEWNSTGNYHSSLTFIPTRTKIRFYAWCSIDQPQLGPQDSDIHDIEITYGPGAPALWFTNNVVYAGGTAAMTCSLTPGTEGTDGNPTVTEYTWLFGNEALVDSNFSHVTFAVTSVTQEGQYACYGTNHPLGGSMRGDASQPEYLKVNVSPYLVQPSAPSDAMKVLYNDQNTYLSCLGAGKPEVDFNWYHNGDHVDENDFIEEKAAEAGDYLYDLKYGWRSFLMRAIGGAYFTCDNITKYDGHYQCEAYNDEEVSNMSTPVRVITHYPAHWAGPVPHHTRYTSPGDNFTLLCDVCMKPRGNIAWYLNGEPVKDNVSISDDGHNLSLTDVQLEDFGNYSCQVTNIIQEERHTRRFELTLMQYGAPYTPSLFRVNGSTSRSLNVSWLPGSTGGYDSQTFTLCYVAHDVHAPCQVGIQDPGDGNLIRESLRDLEVNTTCQLQLYAENAHHDNNRSSLTALNHSTKVAPVIKVLSHTLSATRITVTWVVKAGEPSHLTLVHCSAEDCDVTTQMSRRDVKATWRELATNIPPDVGTYTYEAQEGEPFDDFSYNRFNLGAYEPGLKDRSNADDNASWDVPPRPSDGVDIGLVVGIVVALVAAAALATGGFVYYRKKATKDGDDHSVKRPNYSDNNKGFRDDQVQYEDIDEVPRDHSVSSASSAPKEYGTYEDVTSMSIMATSRQHRALLDDAVCVDVPIKLPFDEVDDDASYMGLHHHDNNDNNNAYEELQVTETMT